MAAGDKARGVTPPPLAALQGTAELLFPTRDPVRPAVEPHIPAQAELGRRQPVSGGGGAPGQDVLPGAAPASPAADL